MYKRGRGSFFKHLDFLVADMVVMQLVFMLCYIIRHWQIWGFMFDIYRQMCGVLFLVQLCVIVIQKSFRGIIRRDHVDEFVQVAKYVTYIILILFAYMFIGKTSFQFSRTVFLLTWGIGIIVIYIERIILKNIVRKRLEKKRDSRSIILVGENDKVLKVVKNSIKNRYRDYRICGIIITDQNRVGQEVKEIPIIGFDDIPRDFMVENVVDEILLYYGVETENVSNIVETCVDMGLTMHKVIAETPPMSEKTIVEEFSGYTVLTTSIGMASARQLFLKRCMDIAGGLVGIFITGILIIILGPIIYIKSPGPVFFSQIRIGKNGRRFKIYKFRSMYMDAEERKKELMAQNEMQGLMFKMENDPRIIKGIGNFIRNTSLDEFPQFWNVLKGDMSLVGTRPPTLEEYEQYDDHHKKRLVTKPGITGMWQVSGRSNITDFEEIVALDTKYITEWSLGLDIKILFKTILVVLKNDGAK